MSNYTKDTVEQEMSCYRVLGSFDQNESIVASGISDVISCMRVDISSKIDSDEVGRLFVHMSGDVDIGPMAISAGLSVATGAVIGSGLINDKTGTLVNGDACIALSSFTHAEGSQTSAAGTASHAEGGGAVAANLAAHAEGAYTTASGVAAHSEGLGFREGPIPLGCAVGPASHSEGFINVASNIGSHVDGVYASDGQYKHTYVWRGHDGMTFTSADVKALINKTEDLTAYYAAVDKATQILASLGQPYQSHGDGTFNISPTGEISGFYIGNKSLYEYLKDLSDSFSSEMSNYLDKRTGGIVSGNVDISGDLSALNDITTSSGIHAFRHGLVGTDVDFSTGGDEVLVVGHEHKIYGKESFIAGNEGNILGAKAFHWKAIDTTNNLIYLTHEQTKFNSGSIPSSRITEIAAGNYVSQSDYKKYDIPYFGPRSESYYSDDNNASCLFKADKQISILKDDVYSGNPPKLVQKGAVGKTLILNNVQNVPYFRKLVVEDVLSGSVLSVRGLDTIETSYQQTHYRKNTNHTYHGNYYFVCFQDVPDISTYTDGSWEKNMTFGCAALGENNCTIGYNSFAIGKDNTTEGNYSIALGYNAKAGNNSVFAWSGNGAYNVSGEGQFGINPKSGISGFYIGDNSLAYYLKDLSGDLDGEIQNKLDKRYGGIVSSDIGVFQHDMKILSGNYIQTNDDDLSVQNFSYKNAFLQAECPDSRWGIACTGAKGYCILSVNSPERKIKLSGDISLLESNKSEKYSWSFGSGGDCQSFEISTVNVDDHIITLKNAIPNDLYKEISGLTSEEEYKHLFETDDNAFYCPSKPDIGNTVIHNFYANHAEGGSVKAIGKYTHAEGRGSIADMRYSHAEGDRTVAGRMASHAEGQESKAYGHYSHAEGYRTQVQNDSQAAHAEGYNTTARGNGSHAEGKSTNKCGNPSAVDSDVITEWNSKKFTLTKSDGAHAEGADTLALSRGTHAEGVETIAQGGAGAHAEGNLTKATGITSHAEGIKTVASGFASHTEGYQTSATISASHAEGYLTYAKGAYSHAEGNQTSAIGMYSHAQGEKTKAQRDNAHAAGYMCEANAWNSTAIGRYSRVLSTDNNAFVWQGLHETTNPSFYESKGIGTFCINPKDSALSNVWIGSRNLSDIISTEIDSAQSHADSAVNQLKSQISSALSTITANPLSSLTYSSDIDKVISAAVEMRNILSNLYDAMRG